MHPGSQCQHSKAQYLLHMAARLNIPIVGDPRHRGPVERPWTRRLCVWVVEVAKLHRQGQRRRQQQRLQETVTEGLHSNQLRLPRDLVAPVVGLMQMPLWLLLPWRRAMGPMACAADKSLLLPQLVESSPPAVLVQRQAHAAEQSFGALQELAAVGIHCHHRHLLHLNLSVDRKERPQAGLQRQEGAPQDAWRCFPSQPISLQCPYHRHL